MSSQPFGARRADTHRNAEHDQNESVKEDITEKQSTKLPSQQPLPHVAVLSPELLKTKVHALTEELLSFEGDGMPEEEKLPEDSKNASLNLANSLNSDSKNPISVPGTSSSALVGTTSATQSRHHEVKIKMPNYLAVPDPYVLKRGFSKDPSIWSEDQMIQFMKHKDL